MGVLADRLIELADRHVLNQLIKGIGIRPVGKFRADISNLLADLAEIAGESPEYIQDLRANASRELEFDQLAGTVGNQMEQAEAN